MLLVKQVWWPLFHFFRYLYPNYDDFEDGHSYLDNAYIRPTIRICLKIDGYGPHLKTISRGQFSDSLERPVGDLTVIRFTNDQVKEKFCK
jgi:hypothetical protein